MTLKRKGIKLKQDLEKYLLFNSNIHYSCMTNFIALKQLLLLHVVVGCSPTNLPFPDLVNSMFRSNINLLPQACLDFRPVRVWRCWQPKKSPKGNHYIKCCTLNHKIHPSDFCNRAYPVLCCHRSNPTLHKADCGCVVHTSDRGKNISQLVELECGLWVGRGPASGDMFTSVHFWVYFCGIWENINGNYLFIYSL